MECPVYVGNQRNSWLAQNNQVGGALCHQNVLKFASKSWFEPLDNFVVSPAQFPQEIQLLPPKSTEQTGDYSVLKYCHVVQDRMKIQFFID